MRSTKGSRLLPSSASYAMVVGWPTSGFPSAPADRTFADQADAVSPYIPFSHSASVSIPALFPRPLHSSPDSPADRDVTRSSWQDGLAQG